MKSGVISDFCQRKSFHPTLGSRANSTSQIAFQTMVDTFSLSITLCMICRAHTKLCIQQVKQFIPEIACKHLSLSDTIVFGMPWSLTMLEKKTSATDCAVYGCLRGKKCAYLIKRSTITNMIEYPSLLGRPSIRSMDKSCHTCSGIGRGLRRLGVLQFSCFAC
jgi:hypothetical protein